MLAHARTTETAMTDQTSETETSETETSETEATASESPAADVEAEDDESEEDEKEGEDEEGEDEEGEDDDDDDKKSKKDKPKKLKVSYEASMPRNEAVSYFEAIVGGLRSGRLEFKQEGDTLVLNPPDQLEIEVKAQLKGDKGKVVFEIEWSDENRPLEIVN
jgi:amphi-Trp domain-containing protein